MYINIKIFKRIEKKYLLNEEQYQSLMYSIDNHLEKDAYFESNINNIYFDNDNYDLIINSIEKPIYKEKIRLRSYGIPSLNDKVFLEIKKKYNDIVNKRRIEITLQEFYDYFEKGIIPIKDEQIMNEIDYCFKKYNLKPKFFVSYNRNSYYDKDNKDLRITFDKHLVSRTDNLRLDYGNSGDEYFKTNTYIMEIKSLGALPLWFTNILSELKIYPTSFSKIGKIYMKNKKEEVYV